MLKKVFMSFVALVAMAAAATGPARAQSHQKYTSGTVAVSALQEGDTLCQGATINKDVTGAVMFAANRWKYGNPPVVKDAGAYFNVTPYTILDGAAIAWSDGYATPVDENGNDGDAWIVTSKTGTDYVQLYLGGILLPPPPLYTVKMAPGTEDSTSWTFNPGAAVTDGVAEGTVVNISYGGTRKVKSVVAAVVPDAPAALTLNLTSPTVGQVIGSDGKNYAYASLPTGVTALARICYVNGSNGLAMAMADEGQMAWSAAITTCEAHTPAFANGTWKLPTKAEWDNMISAAGGISTLREVFSGIGGDNLQYVRYWSATEDESNDSNAYNIMINDGTWATFVKTNVYRYVRAVLAW